MKFINGLNRAVVVIICLVLMVGLTALFLMPEIVLRDVGQWMVNWGGYLGGQVAWIRLAVGIVLTIVVDALLLIAIFLEVRRGRQRYIRVQQVAGGMATIGVDSVTELLHYKLDPLPGVIKVIPDIRAKGNRVDARVEVGVSRGTNVPETANRVIREIQSALTDDLGMQIAGQPQVRVTVLAQEGRRVAPTRTPPPIPVPSTAPSGSSVEEAQGDSLGEQPSQEPDDDREAEDA